MPAHYQFSQCAERYLKDEMRNPGVIVTKIIGPCLQALIGKDRRAAPFSAGWSVPYVSGHCRRSPAGLRCLCFLYDLLLETVHRGACTADKPLPAAKTEDICARLLGPSAGKLDTLPFCRALELLYFDSTTERHANPYLQMNLLINCLIPENLCHNPLQSSSCPSHLKLLPSAFNSCRKTSLIYLPWIPFSRTSALGSYQG